MNTDSFTRGLEHLGAGNLEAAIMCLTESVASAPDLIQAHHALSFALIKAGKTEEAIQRLEVALGLAPFHHDMRATLIHVFSLQERWTDVLEHLSHLPASPETQADQALVWHKIAVEHHQKGQTQEALASLERSLALNPDNAEVYNSLGVVWQAQDNGAKAELAYQHAIALNPTYAAAHNNWGTVLFARGQWREAEACFRAALALKPDYPEAHNNLGNALKKQGLMEQAKVCYHQALALDPQHALALNNLGTTLQDQGDFGEAERCYRQALDADSNYAEAHNNLGGLLQDLGRLAEARSQMERSVALNPDNAVAHYNLALIKRFKHEDRQIAQLLSLTDHSDPIQRLHAHFALSKAYEDCGQLEQAFDHQRQGNGLKRAVISYDETATLRLFDRIIETFTTKLTLPTDERKDGPIFILGMPRSGTSLIEQILASHPQVYGAGELDLFNGAVETVLGKDAYPEALSQICQSEIERIGAHYLSALRTKTPSGKRITDKMPHNFFYCGLILMTLPQARILHICRDPVDTCLSCYSKLFVDAQDYTYDLAELGRYYRQYQRLMDHWRTILPPEAMLEVQYESVVQDLPNQTRLMLEYCGLEWDDACLDFHRTNRPVLTASAAQVRQPIYTSSVGRWQPSPDILQPLKDALEAP